MTLDSNAFKTDKQKIKKYVNFEKKALTSEWGSLRWLLKNEKITYII